MSRAEQKQQGERRHAAPRQNESDARPRRPRATRFQDGEKLSSLPEVVHLREYLATLGDDSPSIHINGPGYPFALLTVDFGQGKNSRPPTEIHDDILVRVRSAGRAVSGHGGDTIRVHMDNSHGIWWVSL